MTMKYLGIWKALFVLIVLNLSSGVQADNDIEHDLVLKIHCPQRNIRQGDEIPIIFTITNKGSSAYSFEKRESDRSGRIREYKLVARQKDETVVPDPRENYVEGIGGGLGGGKGKIWAGQSFSRTIALNRWALIKEPGVYSVTGIHSYNIPETDPTIKMIPGVRRMKRIYVQSEPIEIVIKSRGRWRMGRYINKLKRDLNAITPSKKRNIVEKREEIIAKLAYTCDDRIVPTLLDLMYENHHNNEIFWAREAFLCYLPNNPEIKNAVLKEAKDRGLAPGMQSVLEKLGCTEKEFKDIIAMCLASDRLDILKEGVLAAQDYPDDEHMPKLISIAMDAGRIHPNNSSVAVERWRAIYAIAYNRTDEGVKTLRTLLKDPNEEIRKTTQDAIRSAYRRHPEYPRDSDEEFTDKMVPVAADAKHPWHMYCVIVILRTRTIEGVRALRLLADHPGQNIAIAETDPGVKSIKDLLRNPDKEISQFTSDLIKGIYREYPGRPLRNDDFPEKFRENPEERKKMILDKIGKR